MSLFNDINEDDCKYGVKWNDEVNPKSHCWFPYSTTRTSSSLFCSYSSCNNIQSENNHSYVQCGSCLILIHEYHLMDCNTIDLIDNCRQTFIDDNLLIDKNENDEHYWSIVRSMKKRCFHCQRKKIEKNRENQIIDSNENDDQSNLPMRKRSHLLSNYFKCLWCERYCHERCYQMIKDQNNCDYGQFKNIIIRPHWIHRDKNVSQRFYIRLDLNMNENNLLLNPIIILINKYSGGQQGQVIYRQLIQILNPRQVFLLENSAMLDSILEMYKYLENIRIFICGGDGTVGWVLSRIAEKYSSLKNPPVSICPLGTGNDLARVLGWGWTYQSKNLFKTLLQTSVAQPVPFDRWKISLESLRETNINDEHRNATRLLCSCLLEEPKFVVETDPPSYLNYRQPLNTHFTNYLSFGLDAAVVLDFHHQRIQNPSRFTSPTKNKFLYINISRKYLKEFVLWKSWSLFPYMKLICDGVDLTDSLRYCHSLILLNIPSYGSGARPWARTSNNISSETTDDNNLNQSFQSNRQNSSTIFQQQSFADRKIEVLGLNSIEMAFIHIGCRGQRIAQCHQVTIELDRSMPVHMDGEPFYLSRSTAIHITHAGQVLLLSNSSS